MRLSILPSFSNSSLTDYEGSMLETSWHLFSFLLTPPTYTVSHALHYWHLVHQLYLSLHTLAQPYSLILWNLFDIYWFELSTHWMSSMDGSQNTIIQCSSVLHLLIPLTKYHLNLSYHSQAWAGVRSTNISRKCYKASAKLHRLSLFFWTLSVLCF